MAGVRAESTGSPRVWTLAAFALFFAMAFGLRAAAGELDCEPGHFDDEPAHIVTALMIRDYLAAGGFEHPLRYAEEYYIAHPKVAIGQWPPVLHATFGLWMLAFGTSRLAVVCGAAFLAALGAAVVRALGGRFTPEPLPTLLGLVFLGVGLVQGLSAAVMTELPLAITTCVAALAFGTFIDRGLGRWLLVFVVCAVLAILTKGNALGLALVPLLAALMAGSPGILRDRRVWLGGLAVGLLTGPWYVATAGLARGTWIADGPSWAYARWALDVYSRELLRALGPVGVVLFCLGVASGLARRDQRGVWAALLAWILAWAAMHFSVPSSVEARHFVLVLPVFLGGAGAGAGWLAGLTPLGQRGRALLAAALIGVPWALGGVRFEDATSEGFAAAIERLRVEPGLEGTPWLVASDALGEGLAVSAAALSDPERPGQVLLRASKVLAKANWIGSDYKERFTDEPGLEAYLLSVPCSAVLIDTAAREGQRFGHIERLRSLFRGRPDRWRYLGALPVQKAGERTEGALELYALNDHAGLARTTLSLEFVRGD